MTLAEYKREMRTRDTISSRAYRLRQEAKYGSTEYKKMVAINQKIRYHTKRRKEGFVTFFHGSKYDSGVATLESLVATPPLVARTPPPAE